ncbi:MAG TPA: hypothetical protein VG733_19025, partial [Chthoniobacteraceae bacterium]|nr:hypothetical protein [Chthoniobacteraceae bacterium]
MKMTPIIHASALAFAVTLHAQVFQPQAPAPAPAAAPAAQAPAQSKQQQSFLGKDIPLFNPGTNNLTIDGKTWNVTNNEFVAARFEKYLDAPEETGADDKAYQEIIRHILDDLAPGNQTVKTVDDAFISLPKASNYDIDAHLCDALADAVYSAWRAQNQAARIQQANAALEEERKKHEWNLGVASQQSSLDPAPPANNGAAQKAYTANTNAKQNAQMLPEQQRLAEVLAMIQKNNALMELNKVQMKIEFQALIVQFMLQRRYQHVLMATRFYRAVFSDGEDKIDIKNQKDNIFANASGMPPTVATVDSMANEAIRDVREGVQAFKFLVSQNQLEGASKRLAEAFAVGEYMPEIRTLPREEKQKALKFVHQNNELISAINVKDYARAESIVKDLEKTAVDFDNSEPLAAIETAKTICSLHVAKATNAMVSGDKVTLEAEVKAAFETWPRSPQLAEF